jgi:sugar phosphate isomerase/epimerase
MNSPLKPLAEEIRIIASLGFDFLELAMDPPGAYVDELRKDRTSLVRALGDSGLGLVCHLPTFLSTADLSPRIRAASVEETLLGMEVAAELGARRAVLHPSFFVGLGPKVREMSRQLAMACLGELVNRSATLRLDTCLENMFSPGGWLTTADEFAPVLSAFPQLGITLDIGHAHIRGGSDCACAFLRRYPDRIRHLHLSDNWGRRDDHLPLGTGTVRIEAVLVELRRLAETPWITLEVFSPDRDYLRISREKFLRLWEEAQAAG